MATVNVKNLSKKYGSTIALDHIDLSIPEGSLTSLLGPSGCGKTTALRLIAGFEKPNSGDIYVNEELVNDIPVNKRNIGMVFQSYALFPHMSAKENISYGLKQQKLSIREIEQRTGDAIKLVQLTGHEYKKPNQLSGGQQQRVALARALVIKPKVLLLDECLSALDKKLRVEMQAELRGILKASNITALFVTHDQEEALTLSDYVVVMNDGRVVQTGKPYEVYEKPRNCFVAGFLGKANFFERVTGDHMSIHCVRPEKIKLNSDPPDTPFLEGTIEFITYAGNITTYTLDCTGKRLLVEEQNASGSAKFKLGARVYAGWLRENFLLMED